MAHLYQRVSPGPFFTERLRGRCLFSIILCPFFIAGIVLDEDEEGGDESIEKKPKKVVYATKTKQQLAKKKEEEEAKKKVRDAVD